VVSLTGLPLAVSQRLKMRDLAVPSM